MDTEGIKHVIEYISIFSSLGEVTAGSLREGRQVELIRSIIDDHVDDVVIEPVEVSSWDEEFCVLHLDGKTYRCSVHPPYEGYIDIHASRDSTIHIHNIELLNHGCNKLVDKVAIVDGFEDPNYVAIYTYMLKKCNPSLIIFIDNYEALRRIATLDEIISTQKPTTPPKVPTIHVTKSTGEKLLSSQNIHIIAKSVLKASYGYNVIARVNNASDKYLYITSHHDHWFSGVSDDVVGVALMLVLPKDPIIKKIVREGIVLAFFTAEEGFPYPLSSFYWLVGSKKHVTVNASRLLDEVALVLNLDVLYRGRPKFSSSNLIARGLLAKMGIDVEDIEHDSMLFDSFSFTSLGIPSITMHSYDEALNGGLYHSTLDTVDILDIDALRHMFNTIHELMKSVRMVREEGFKKLMELGAKSIALELAKTIKPLEVVLDLYRSLRFLIDCPDIEITNKYVPSFHRVITTTYVSKDIYRGLRVYEETSYITCRNDYIYLPTEPSFNSVDECYRNAMFNLESLTYILLKHCIDMVHRGSLIR